MTIRALIVEDEELIRWSLRQKFEARGYRVDEAADGSAALSKLDGDTYDLVILDYKLPDMTGIDVLKKLRGLDTAAAVIMMTAFSTIENAVGAIKLGAFDYVPKPFQMDDLLRTIDQALETTRLRREVRELRRRLEAEQGRPAIIGDHPLMRRVLDMMRQVAGSAASSVLLRGETGTGKDLVARAIHQLSARSDAPFINITCTALSETLLESELFGHERGAFTDARTQKQGLLEAADGGTVFLDEIGDMVPGLQAKLLRFLEDRRFRRVGGTREIAVDVRVIAATNRDIAAAIAKGQFREDLYYRLNVVTIDLPPLRARGDDVILLAGSFAERFSREFRKPIATFDEEALGLLVRHSWPGNVRELRNAVERAVLLCPSQKIGAADLAIAGGAGPREPLGLDSITLSDEGFPLSRLADVERRLLAQALERTQNNQVRAARLLHVSRDRLRYRLRKYGLLSDASDLGEPRE